MDSTYRLWVERWDAPGGCYHEDYDHEDMAHYAQQEYEAQGIHAWVETPEDRRHLAGQAALPLEAP